MNADKTDSLQHVIPSGAEGYAVRVFVNQTKQHIPRYDVVMFILSAVEGLGMKNSGDRLCPYPHLSAFICG